MKWWFGVWDLGFESCIRHMNTTWKTTCLLSIQRSLAGARASKLTIKTSISRKQTGTGVEWAECSLIIGMGCRVLSLIPDSSVGLSAGIQSAIWCLRPWVRILHSAEEDNLSPFDSKIACLCQSIEINNNTHAYRQSQVRKQWGRVVTMILSKCNRYIIARPYLAYISRFWEPAL